MSLRCLSLHQPWASLVAVGVKANETRSWPTKHRGRIGIASTAKRPADGFIGAYEVASSGRLREAMGPGSWYPLPLGALVATANLVDCVPMVSWAPLDGPATWAAHMIPSDPRSETPRTILLRDARVGAEALRTNGPLPAEIDATDQLPYGDFTPGRWAWLLDDVKATTERCPACWGYGGPLGSHADLTGSQLNDGGAEAAYVVKSRCPTCDGNGVSDPVPVKGRQGLWRWEGA